MNDERPIPALHLAVGCGIGFVVLTVLVASHATDHLDVVLRDRLRPHDQWELPQRRADHVVQALRPSVMAVILAVAAIGWALRRRSWWPLAYAALIGLSAAILTRLTKVLLGRPDPHGEVQPHSGSYSSGHTISVLICLGGALLLMRMKTHWWQWILIGLAAAVMGLSLVVEGAHWFTDVLGGALLGGCLLAVASLMPWRQRSVGPSQQDPGGSDRAALGEGASQEQARQP